VLLQLHSKCCCRNLLLTWSSWWGYGPVCSAVLDAVIWSQLLKLLTVAFSAFILLWSSCFCFCLRRFSRRTFPLTARCSAYAWLFPLCAIPGWAAECPWWEVSSTSSLTQHRSLLLYLLHSRYLCFYIHPLLPLPTREREKYLLPYVLYVVECKHAS